MNTETQKLDKLIKGVDAGNIGDQLKQRMIVHDVCPEITRFTQKHFGIIFFIDVYEGHKSDVLLRRYEILIPHVLGR